MPRDVNTNNKDLPQIMAMGKPRVDTALVNVHNVHAGKWKPAIFNPSNITGKMGPD